MKEEVREEKNSKIEVSLQKQQNVEIRLGLKGDKGEPFKYEDFTSEQLAALKGPKGDIGPIGPKGATGEKGDKGDTGPKGERGITGPQGPQGAQGPKGERGLVGPAGATGPKGEQGIQGPKGPTGEKGATGPVGAQGPKGDAFKYSDFTPEQLNGLKGPKGDTGNTGPAGAAGTPGKAATIAVGTVTTTGSGTQAAVTNVGTSSAAVFNFSIPKGKDGILKFQDLTEEEKKQLKGDKGDPGPAGPTGPQGPKGNDGAKGSNGADGKSAYQIWKDLGNTGTEQDFINQYVTKTTFEQYKTEVGNTYTKNSDMQLILAELKKINGG